jgi:hypothetical protein
MPILELPYEAIMVVRGKEWHMTTKKTLLIISLAATFTSVGYGAPMGPPMALLGEGKWGVGVEYGRDSIDLKAHGDFDVMYTAGAPHFRFLESIDIDSLTMNMLYGTIGYGLCDTWDVFVRLGVADAQDDMSGTGITYQADDPGTQQTYRIGALDSDYGFSVGGGTRVTFGQSGPWTFGGLVQATWFRPKDSDISYTDPFQGPDALNVGEVTLDFWEAQVALAASYQVDTVRLWAGPFLEFVRGDVERDGAAEAGDFRGPFVGKADLEENSQLGAHLGADWRPNETVDLWVEGQITSDSWFLGIGLVYKPEETYGM